MLALVESPSMYTSPDCVLGLPLTVVEPLTPDVVHTDTEPPVDGDPVALTTPPGPAAQAPEGSAWAGKAIRPPTVNPPATSAVMRYLRNCCLLVRGVEGRGTGMQRGRGRPWRTALP